MTENYIHSRQNDQIKNLVKLRERKHRDRQSRFVVEGLREIGHAIAAGFELEDLYFCPELFPHDTSGAFIDDLRSSGRIPLTRVSKEVFCKASLREGPDGLIAVARQEAHSLATLKLPANPLLLVLEGIEKPGNLGAILRSADGAGAHAVVLVDCLLDLYNPNAIRSSQGLVFALPIVHAERDFLRKWLANHAISIVAATPGTPLMHWELDFSRPTALFMGSESDGLSTYWLEYADHRIRLPMEGRADSLNVAAATAVCLYEARRQRHQQT